MNNSVYRTASVLLALGAGVLALCATAAMGQRGEAAKGNAPSNAATPANAPIEPSKTLPPLRVYEWGVTTLHWDGTPEPEEALPAAFYGADRIPLEPPRNRGAKPEVRPAGTAKPRKPVIYVEHDLAAASRIVFDLDIRFPNGRVTWAYPLPSRRLDEASIQWDNVELVNDATAGHQGGTLPTAAKFPAGHWAETAREGSTSSLLAAKEVERYLFYEGEQFDLPELDLYLAPDGSIRLQNHGFEAVHDVRVNVSHGGAAHSHHVPLLAAASAETPSEVILGEKTRADPRPPAGTLEKETVAAGLTAPQGRVFEAIWREELHGGSNTLSWQRGPRALERMAEIRLTLPAGMGSEVKRAGYVLARRVDLSLQAALDAHAARAAQGDAEAVAALKQSGMAGAGALRRLSRLPDLSLEARLALAKLLAQMAAPPPRGE